MTIWTHFCLSRYLHVADFAQFLSSNESKRWDVKEGICHVNYEEDYENNPPSLKGNERVLVYLKPKSGSKKRGDPKGKTLA